MVFTKKTLENPWTWAEEHYSSGDSQLLWNLREPGMQDPPSVLSVQGFPSKCCVHEEDPFSRHGWFSFIIQEEAIDMFDICARTERTLTLMVGCEGHFSGKLFQRENGFRVDSKKWDNKKRINVHWIDMSFSETQAVYIHSFKNVSYKVYCLENVTVIVT